MCGIAAILSFDRRPDDFRAIGRMAETLVHRGPDDAGFVFSSASGEVVECARGEPGPPRNFQPILAMGIRRLSIIDLSASGHQPMCNEDRTLWLVFNGEIYNYVELAETLKARGHVLRSRSDTEVILHAYEEWGPDCVSEFNGMWAFALWDTRRRRLFCSRDRFGVKPLYYAWDGRTLCLASEPKAILRSGFVAPRPAYPYLCRFLTEGVFQDAEETFYDGIRSVPPGHSVVVESAGLRQYRYWDYDNPDVSGRYDFSHPEETFRKLLIDAVRLRLRSDVPLGACLSGGLDSSTIVAIVARLHGQGSLDTFSAVFDSEKNDESVYMKHVAEVFETRNNTIQVDAKDFFEIVPRIVWHLDGPCLSASTYPFWKVAELARQRVKVLLDGQGADELLGGYWGFLPACVVSSHRAFLRSPSARGLLRTGAELVNAVRLAGWRQLYFLYRDYSYLGRAWKPHRRVLLTERVIHPDLRAVVHSSNGRPQQSAARKFEDELTQTLYDTHGRHGLPGLLQYGDAISMAHSLEARLPFMDYRLVEFCFALPPDTKIRGTTTKWLLRQAMRSVVPDLVLDRKDKIGFATPFADWIRHELRGPLMDILGSQRVREHGVFDVATLRKALVRHLRGQVDMSFYIWRWLTTELWLQQCDQLSAEVGAERATNQDRTSRNAVSCVSR